MIAAKGNKVRVHYRGTLDNGEVFDSSQDREPLEFTIGAGQMIPGFDEGVEGMKIGEKKTLKLSPEKAYGNKREDLIFTIAEKSLPKNYKPEIGDRLQLSTVGGGFITACITAIQEDTISMDANHELAGETLTFEVELLTIA